MLSDYLRVRTYSGQRGAAPALAKMPVRPAGFGQASGGGMASRNRATTAGGQHERMSAVDTAWLRMDGPASTMMIVSVMTTATPVPAADLRRVLETRLLCFPRFRKRVETDPLGASWIEDSNFDLDAHFVVTRLPGRAERDELQALAARLASERFDPARPLWQLHLVEHYGTGSAWVLRLHHCYADGIAMIRVLLSLTEQDAGPALAGAQAAESRTGSRGRRKGAADPLQLLDWISQLSQPAGDIVENVLAEGARLLETGVHRLFHPETAAAIALQARRHGRRIRAGPRAARRPGVTAARALERREARGVVGAARPAGGEDREPGARLHRQRRADGDRGRRARRLPARRTDSTPRTSCCARRCR